MALALQLPKRMLSASWHGANRRISAVIPGSALARQYRHATFANIYEKELWGPAAGGKYFSGTGSIGEMANTYVRAMAPVLAESALRLGAGVTIVDLGCGDFRVGSALLAALPEIRYVGCDIVADLIAQNNLRHGSERISFRCLDMVTDPLPPGDIFLVRQVLQHLSNRDIESVLNKLRNRPYVFITEGQPSSLAGPINPDMPAGAGVRYDWKSGTGRGVELDKPPYNCHIEEICRAYSDPAISKDAVITYRISPARKKGQGDGD